MVKPHDVYGASDTPEQKLVATGMVNAELVGVEKVPIVRFRLPVFVISIVWPDTLFTRLVPNAMDDRDSEMFGVGVAGAGGALSPPPPPHARSINTVQAMQKFFKKLELAIDILSF
jgi:hypothetical protein